MPTHHRPNPIAPTANVSRRILRSPACPTPSQSIQPHRDGSGVLEIATLAGSARLNQGVGNCE